MSPTTRSDARLGHWRVGFGLRSPDENMAQSGDLWACWDLHWETQVGKATPSGDKNGPEEGVLGRRVEMLLAPQVLCPGHVIMYRRSTNAITSRGMVTSQVLNSANAR
jgi:hypothetical protein